MDHGRRIIICNIAILLLSSSVLAQTLGSFTQSMTGVQPQQTYDGARENIDLATGNLNIQIPLLSLPGRNGHDLNVAIQYDSKTFALHAVYTGVTTYYWDRVVRQPAVGGPGWRLAVPTLAYGLSYHGASGDAQNSFLYSFAMTSGDGSTHTFKTVVAGCLGTAYQVQICNSGRTGGANDDTFLFLDASACNTGTTTACTVIVRTQDGTKYYFTVYPGTTSGGDIHQDRGFLPNKIEDTNGNVITLAGNQNPTSMTDTLGRVVTFTWTSNHLQTITFKDSAGVNRVISFTYSSFTEAAQFTTPTSNVWPYDRYSEVLSTVNLPSGRSFAFSYNGFGELSKITYPWGGYTSYVWSRYTNKTIVPLYSVVGGPFTSTVSAADFRQVTEKHVCRNASGTCGTEDITYYTPTVDNSKSNNQSVSVNDPLGNKTVTQFTTSSYASSSFRPQTTTVQQFQGTTTLLRTTTYSYNDSSCLGITGLGSPTEIKTTLNDSGQVAAVQYDYDISSSYGSCNFYTHNSTQKREYDFGNGVIGPLVRKTVTSWLKTSNYITANIWNRKLSEAIQDSAGNTLAQTQWEYDNYTEGILSSGAVQHNPEYGGSFALRGNITAIKQWRNSDGAWLTTRNQFDDSGNILSKTAPSNSPYDSYTRRTTYSFVDSWSNSTCAPSGGNAAALVTQITDAAGLVSSFSFNSCTGTLASETDPNTRTTTYTYDLMNRRSQTNTPDQGQVSVCYSDVPGSSCYSATSPLKVVTTEKITSSINKVSTVVLDGLNRVSQTQLNSDPKCTAQGGAKVDKTYDADERLLTVSNPYCTTSDSIYGITTYEYDGLGRTRKVIPPDGSSSANNLSTSYLGNCATVTDQAGKARKSCSDGLGRLVKVFEDPNGANYETDYEYDVLNNLKRADQKGSAPTDSAQWRTRTLTYNSLSQLLTANNPESGLTTYTYDSVGNVRTKANANGITTTYSYDSLNRLTGKTFSDGTTPAVSYTYDVAPQWMPDLQNIRGRLAFSANQYAGTTSGYATASTYSYDSVGRLVREWQQTPSTSPLGKYVYSSYDLFGNLASTTTAAGTVITYAYDSASRVSTITSSLNDSQHPQVLYAVDPSLGYYANGALRKATLGNGLTETFSYNKRLQPCRMNVNTTGGQFNTCEDSTPSGSVLDFTTGYDIGIANSGNVVSWSASGAQVFNRSYSYDSINRIQNMSDAASGQACKGISWNIDAWGNLLAQNVTAGSCYTFQLVGANNNRLQSGYQYDAAGNMTYDGSHYYSYDAENQLIAVDSGTTASYVYNENGERVRKNVGSTWTEYFYGPSGTVQSELEGSTWPAQYVYVGSELIAKYTSSTTQFVHTDHLGSTRLITSVSGIIIDNLDYLPFGRQISGGSVTTRKFTGKERDDESGLDYFGARYYNSLIGRFMIPDWAARPTAVPYANFGNPQSLNLYSYVENNPTTTVDLDGHLSNYGDMVGIYGAMQGGVRSPGTGIKVCIDSCLWSSFMTDDASLVFARDEGAGYSSDAALKEQQLQQSQEKPSRADIQSNIRTQADGYGIPQAIALATAAQESNFTVEQRGSSGEVGLFQIMPSHKGETLTDASGKSFKLDFAKAADPKQWQYNVKAGLSLLKKDYLFAVANAPKDVARATYAHYNAPGHWSQYRKYPKGVVARHVAAWMVHYKEFGGK